MGARTRLQTAGVGHRRGNPPPAGCDNVAVDRLAAEAGLAFLEAGGDFADGIIAYEGRQLGAEVFLSFDKDAVTIAKSQRIDAASP